MNNADALVSKFLAETLKHHCENPEAKVEDGDIRGCGEGTCDWEAMDLYVYWHCCGKGQDTSYFDNWNDLLMSLLEWSN